MIMGYYKVEMVHLADYKFICIVDENHVLVNFHHISDPGYIFKRMSDRFDSENRGLVKKVHELLYNKHVNNDNSKEELLNLLKNKLCEKLAKKVNAEIDRLINNNFMSIVPKSIIYEKKVS